ncbi:MAG: hypothetical protein ICV73_07155 [Acetobacteraceae bacterium]|nr:hypothetical protein [Acetobacteraceae bacterium]
MDTGFYIRALWPGMEPETEENRATFQASIHTEAGQRVLQILLVPNRAGMPWPVARWMLQNLASGPGRTEADRADVEAFQPASPETFGLRALPGKPLPGSTWIRDDLLRGALADGRFVGMRCGRDPDPDRDRLTPCKLWFDWRQSARLEATFVRAQLPRWREVAEATLALVDGFAGEKEKVDGAGR